MVAEIPHQASTNDPEGRQAPAGPLAILLCTYNGARFLPLQLASFEAQDDRNWRLFVSDDGSQDATLALVEDFRSRHGADKVFVRRGPQQGFVANFLSLACAPEVTGAFYAFSDQDDIWLPSKLSRARMSLDNAPADAPVVYCSRTRLIDEAGAEIGLSKFYRKTPHFRNALVQSLAGGNTMVFNEEMRRLLMKAGADVKVGSHDWWVYLAVTAVGGRILYDSVPTVSYRMHGRNVIGSNESPVAKMLRAHMLWQGRFKSWADMNVAALERIEGLMTDDSRKTFELFRQSRKQSLFPRVWGLLRSRVYRQSWLGDVGLVAAAVAGKI